MDGQGFQQDVDRLNSKTMMAGRRASGCRLKISPLILVAALIACATVRAQQPSQGRSGRRAFEVAAIKPAGPASGQKGIRPDAGGRVTIIGLTVRELVQAAYGRDTLLMPNQVVGGPTWIDSEAFDIVARADERSAPGGRLPFPVMLEMFRSLLEERFSVATHTETRLLPIFALVVDRPDGRLGPNLRAPAGGCRPLGSIPIPGSPAFCGMQNAGPTRLSGLSVSLDLLAGVLTQAPDVGRTVRNQTGLGGVYDVELEFAPMAAGGDGPSLFTALREQLGLRLDSRQGPVEVVVIDRAERPSEN